MSNYNHTTQNFRAEVFNYVAALRAEGISNVSEIIRKVADHFNVSADTARLVVMYYFESITS